MLTRLLTAVLLATGVCLAQAAQPAKPILLRAERMLDVEQGRIGVTASLKQVLR
jgi:hypothetical protein